MLINLFNNKSYFQKAKQNNREGGKAADLGSAVCVPPSSL